MGEGAKTQEMSNFKSTVSCLKRLLARTPGDPDVALEREFVNCKLLEEEQIKAEVSFQYTQQKFSFTQLTAMFLNKVFFLKKKIKLIFFLG